MERLRGELWEKLLGQIREDVGEQKFNLWFRNTSLIGAEDDVLKIGVPNLFIKGWMEENFRDTVSQSATTVCGWQGDVAFSVAGELFRKMRADQLVVAAEQPSVDTGSAQEKAQQEANPRMSLGDFVVGGCNQLAYAAAMEVCYQEEPAFNRLFLYGGVGLGKTHILQGIWQELWYIYYGC